MWDTTDTGQLSCEIKQIGDSCHVEYNRYQIAFMRDITDRR